MGKAQVIGTTWTWSLQPDSAMLGVKLDYPLYPAAIQMFLRTTVTVKLELVPPINLKTMYGHSHTV
jgi:hypothetical protein